MSESAVFTTSLVELKGGGGAGAGGARGEAKVKIRQVASEEFGCFIWPSAVLLSQYLFEHSGVVRNSKVLELGAGVGLPGLLCRKLGASRVLLTDLSKPPIILSNLQHNCCANELEHCSAAPMDWGIVTEEMLLMRRTCYDVLLAADCLYSSSLYEDFLCTASFFLRPAPKGEAGASSVKAPARPRLFTVFQERGSGFSLARLMGRWGLRYAKIDFVPSCSALVGSCREEAGEEVTIC
ncbi:hypothetical protein GUITHDRAFT_141732 [Guillardia theta CCMP2712]|uniref:Uncharacterized protein n=1 Tax=Guillardia theta (strain CCMP2712) TaxID=905079 RepID=L1IZQ9_GUITC|nr:hypothetical protein GUITHDRAFT_141732 [Guillardia theta CCMP2712]EKX41731.1 hypothetical protein GUITHDRAFT_141732 [Guillardia theta CCMP2712]|eukprot:XP_005828711.1 hypothetical protein GUITHDRAFT_141732 [Guillardia theta CCMP2712]